MVPNPNNDLLIALDNGEECTHLSFSSIIIDGSISISTEEELDKIIGSVRLDPQSKSLIAMTIRKAYASPWVSPTGALAYSLAHWSSISLEPIYERVGQHYEQLYGLKEAHILIDVDRVDFEGMVVPQLLPNAISEWVAYKLNFTPSTHRLYNYRNMYFPFRKEEWQTQGSQ